MKCVTSGGEKLNDDTKFDNTIDVLYVPQRRDQRGDLFPLDGWRKGRKEAISCI
jgi:hypothetical protein